MSAQVIPASPGYYVLTCWLPDLQSTEGIDPETYDLQSGMLRVPIIGWRVGPSDCHGGLPITPDGDAYTNALPEEFVGILCPDGTVTVHGRDQLSGENSFIEAARFDWLRRLERQREEDQNHGA